MPGSCDWFGDFPHPRNCRVVPFHWRAAMTAPGGGVAEPVRRQLPGAPAARGRIPRGTGVRPRHRACPQIGKSGSSASGQRRAPGLCDAHKSASLRSPPAFNERRFVESRHELVLGQPRTTLIGLRADPDEVGRLLLGRQRLAMELVAGDLLELRKRPDQVRDVGRRQMSGAVEPGGHEP
jgi:hypothetical protein